MQSKINLGIIKIGLVKLKDMVSLVRQIVI